MAKPPDVPIQILFLRMYNDLATPVLFVSTLYIFKYVLTFSYHTTAFSIHKRVIFNHIQNFAMSDSHPTFPSPVIQIKSRHEAKVFMMKSVHLFVLTLLFLGCSKGPSDKPPIRFNKPDGWTEVKSQTGMVFENPEVPGERIKYSVLKAPTPPRFSESAVKNMLQSLFQDQFVEEALEKIHASLYRYSVESAPEAGVLMYQVTRIERVGGAGAELHIVNITTRSENAGTDRFQSLVEDVENDLF